MRKGSSHTAESRERIKEAWKSRPPVSAETRAKLSEASRGRRVPEETKAKIAATKRQQFEEARRLQPPKPEKPPRKRTGGKRSEETKARMSAAQKKRWTVVPSEQRFTHTEETKARMSAAQKKRWTVVPSEQRFTHTEETKARISETKLRARWGDDWQIKAYQKPRKLRGEPRAEGLNSLLTGNLMLSFTAALVNREKRKLPC